MSSQRGSAMIWAMFVMAMLSAGAYYLNEKAESELTAQDLKKAGESAELSNVSNLAIVRNLVAPRPGVTMRARDPSSMPFVYPEPYLEGHAGPSGLVAWTQPNPNTWSQPGRNFLRVSGWESRRTKAADYEALFAHGVFPARTADKTTTSTLALRRFIRRGDGLITGVELDTDASSKVKSIHLERQGVHRQVNSALTAELAVPPPPAPECDFTTAAYTNTGFPQGSTLDVNGTYTATLRGYGVFSSATANGCAIGGVPAAAHSARNGGVNVAGCVYPLNGGSMINHPINWNVEHPYQYYVTPARTASVSTPWGASASCTVPGAIYRVRRPPSCWFSTTEYRVNKTQCVTMSMTTRFGAAGSIYSPSHGWTNAGQNTEGRSSMNHTFCSNTDDNEPLYYPGFNPSFGHVRGADNQEARCGTSIRIPFRNGICRFQGIWQTLGSCVNHSHTPLAGWVSSRSIGYNLGASNWECRSHLFTNFNCTGTYVGDRIIPGCFTPETLIRQGDGSLKPIKDMFAETDTVLNPLTGEAMKIKQIIAGPETDDLVRYAVAGAEPLTVSSGHPVPVRRAGDAVIVKAEDLADSDAVLGRDGRYHELTLLERVPPAANQIVYNIELATDTDEKRRIEANGFLVTGDLKLQADVEGVPVPPAAGEPDLPKEWRDYSKTPSGNEASP